MTKIKLIIMGHADRVVDFDFIRKHKSKYFKYSDLERIAALPECNKDDGYLDVVYSKNTIAGLLKNIEFDGLCIAVMNYRFDDNFYIHRMGRNKVCFSVAGIENILSEKNISLENFIIKNTYEIFMFYKMLSDIADSEEVYKFIHLDTRGCIFDMNGDKHDIIYNTEHPIICEECKAKINQKPIPEGFIKEIESELKQISKPWIQRVEIFIKKYPLLSVSFAILFPTVINLLSNVIWEKLK